MKEIAIALLNKETEYENRIKALEEENLRLKTESKNMYLEALKMRLSECRKYCNLKDFCRISTSLLFIKEDELKQWMYQQGFLVRTENKYIANKESDICIMVDNEIYVKYEFIRKHILLLRTLVYIGDSDSVNTIIDDFEENKETIIEQMANTVYVSYKQNSNEFKHHKDNRYFSIENENLNKIS